VHNDTNLCAVSGLDLHQLATARLPRISGTDAAHRALGLSAADFIRAVESLEAAGIAIQPAERQPRIFCIWDVYRIWDELVRRTRTVIEIDPPHEFLVGGLRGTLSLDVLDDSWWSAAEGVRQGRQKVGIAALTRDMTVPDGAGGIREENEEERRARLRALRDELEADRAMIAETLPPDADYWIRRLRATASLVLDLRSQNFSVLARLATVHLSSCVSLAESRLHLNRYELRTLVGAVPKQMDRPALTAASSSPEVVAHDTAYDFLQEELPHYNAGKPAALVFGAGEVESFLDFMAESGLQDWYSHLVLAGWDNDFFELGPQLRRARIYGRLRTLGALVEEGLLAMADRTGKRAFADEVEAESTFKPRMSRFIQGPSGLDATVDGQILTRLTRDYRVHPPIAVAELTHCFAGLGIENGAQGVSIEQSPRGSCSFET
jgi:hypothetical protein